MPACWRFIFFSSKKGHTIAALVAVAQLDRVLGYEPRGRGFDSCQPRQMQSPEVKKLQGFLHWQVFIAKSVARLAKKSWNAFSRETLALPVKKKMIDMAQIAVNSREA